MITFRKIRWKNFLATGNAFTEIQLDTTATTLIVGENGAGKSTLLDAIVFALFGHPYRKINKPKLMNSINQKACVVEVEFSIGTKEYKIIRGMRPGVFEIYVDAELINQDAAARDYQKYLEENILKLNYKSFTQIVLLGSASFVPFMQLTVGQRREIIEDLLDIQIFTTMNQVLKVKIQDIKDQLIQADANLRVGVNKARVQEEYIRTLQSDREERIVELDAKLMAEAGEIAACQGAITEATRMIADLEASSVTLARAPQAKKELDEKLRSLQSDIDRLQREVEFYQETDSCRTCKQVIEEDFKATIIAEKTSKIEETERSMESYQDEVNLVWIPRLAQMAEVQQTVATYQAEIAQHLATITASERYVNALTLEKHSIATKVGNIETEKKKLKVMAKEGVALGRARSQLTEERHYYEVAASLLKDSGIKTRIIRQYLPVINKLVNKYLAAMDFFVQFNLDEQFNESIKSRYRDEFTYASFSEGEKQRIDLALLFTWRAIARMKNSANTNLLLLDEVFDSSLDNNGTDYVMSVLNSLGEDTNVVVISHKGDQLFDRFQRVLRFVKKQNYSVLEM